jgi:hypothetical protein
MKTRRKRMVMKMMVKVLEMLTNNSGSMNEGVQREIDNVKW